jgi:glycosyltransferase involved in cell wall biosynthesis
MINGIACVGDASSMGSWSGIPFHFWQAALKGGFPSAPWRVDLGKVSWQRWLWNGVQLLRGQLGGFQYSSWFLYALESQIPDDQWSGGILSFNQHFPRATSVARKGGELNHYLDAPFAALATGRGLDLKLPRRVVQNALELERENYASSRRVISMARWSADVLVQECGVAQDKVAVILPGANLELPDDWQFSAPVGRAGKERAFTLGFVGKDWERKGLPLLIAVRDELTRRGWRVRVRAAGNAPPELQRREGVEFVGYLDKHKDASTFLGFLSDCDVGCLFSEREALGISTLEFLRAGVPVAGYAHEGPADTLPPDAGFRFEPGCGAVATADRFEEFLEDEPMQASFRANARQWSKLVTWERCIREFQELWTTGAVARPVQPWRGLKNQI